jgi:hypothetical protein
MLTFCQVLSNCDAARPTSAKSGEGLGGINSAIVSGKDQPHRGAAVFVEGEFVRRL